MKILIIGSGGREHALAWKVAQNPAVSQVFVAPGNAGTATEAKVSNLALDVLNFPALAEFVQSQGVTLTIVGPEAPLVAGIVDYFAERNLACFGPAEAPLSWKARKPSPRISWPAIKSPPPPTKISQKLNRPLRICAARALP